MNTLNTPHTGPSSPCGNARRHMPRTGVAFLSPRGARCIMKASQKVTPASIVTYTVQKGETLWDVAVQHGVSMRALKDLNKLQGVEPQLSEGQQLLVPATGVTQAFENAPEPPVAQTLADKPARGLWGEWGTKERKRGSIGRTLKP